VRDAAWELARASFDEARLAQLVIAITAINAWNRLNVATLLEPCHYRPGACAQSAA
jgi:alkylhydroperoxidase family enzyme